jgi:hypothetical protein
MRAWTDSQRQLIRFTSLPLVPSLPESEGLGAQRVAFFRLTNPSTPQASKMEAVVAPRTTCRCHTRATPPSSTSIGEWTTIHRYSIAIQLAVTDQAPAPSQSSLPHVVPGPDLHLCRSNLASRHRAEPSCFILPTYRELLDLELHTGRRYRRHSHVQSLLRLTYERPPQGALRLTSPILL